MDTKEIAKEIVVAMIEKGAFYPSDRPDIYVSEVRKAFSAVYKTVEDCVFNHK